METILKNRYIAFLFLAVAGFAVYYNALEGPFVFDDIDYIRENEKIRHLGSFLDLTHPIETQAVSYITQRLVSLAAFFYLLTLVLYLRARKEAASGPFSSRHLLFYIPALLSCVAGQKTKEIAATLPFMLAFVEVLFLSGERKRRLLYLLPFLATALIVPL